MFRKKGGGEADQVNSKTISSKFEDDLLKEFLTDFFCDIIDHQAKEDPIEKAEREFFEIIKKVRKIILFCSCFVQLDFLIKHIKPI